MRRLFLLMTASTLGLGGCCDDPEGLTVRGALTVAIDDAETGFSFASDTLLADEFDDLGDTAVSGHCAIDPAIGDEGEVDVAIVRSTPPEAGSRELQSMGMTLSDSEGVAQGEMSLFLGDSAYHAQVDGRCLLELIYVNTVTGQAGFEVDCLLLDDAGHEAYATAELHFHGCEVLQ